MVDRSGRDLDRERTTLQQQEKKIIGEIKKAAKAGGQEVNTVVVAAW